MWDEWKRNETNRNEVRQMKMKWDEWKRSGMKGNEVGRMETKGNEVG